MGTFESIKKGLEEAIAYANGEEIGAVERTLTANDLFYRSANLRHLDTVIQGIEDGTAKLCEHELIEAEE